MFGDPNRPANFDADMEASRRRTAAMDGGYQTNVSMAAGRPKDPMFYWKQNHLPFDFTKQSELRKLREFCRLLYMTHPVIAACVDIYSKLPLQGVHIECKDPELVEFYTDLFLDQLDYEDHLVKLGRQYWLAGEVFTLGAWNETLGVWEDEQIINPDDVEVEASLFTGKARFMMRLPETLRNILNERSPVYLYQEIAEQYPELLHYTGEDDFMPVSNYIMHHMKFEADDYSNRGISILMRAWRTIIQEEMLMTALDSIADRLYTPFIVAKLGASATDLGTQSPWVPTETQKQEFAGAMDAAFSGDFRVLITHFATEVESLFGRENVPDLSVDFDRITERILMAFGLSQTMLTGASAGETYAADALNRDVVTQLLTHYQRKLQEYFHERAMIVAEAQGHFDYEIRNGERYLITEEIFEIDEETGEEIIKEIPKLLVPELKFKILNLTDEQAQQEFIESLATEGGVPIPIRERIKTLGIEFEEMIEMKQQETVDLAVAEQETRREIYLKLKAAGLPVPDDLLKDFSPKATQAGMAAPPLGASDVAIGQLGMGGPQDLPVLAPTEEDMAGDQEAAEDQMMDQQANEMTDPMAQEGGEGEEGPGDNPDVPEESNEQKGRMPKSSSYSIWQTWTPQQREAFRRMPDEEVLPAATVAEIKKKTAKNIRKISKVVGRRQIRQATRRYYEAPDNSIERDKSAWRPTGKFGAPKHIGMRHYLDVPDDLKLPRDDDD
jgi:hypothetical protein